MGNRNLLFPDTDLKMHVNFDVFLWMEGTLKFPCTLIQCSTNIGRGATLSFLSLREELSRELLITGYFKPLFII